MTTGQYIREFRLKRGMTQEELSGKTDISVRTIQRIEAGDVVPRAYTLQAIAAALEVDFEVLNSYVQADDEEEQQARYWLALLHLSGLLILLFPSLLIWFWKRDSVEGMETHGIDVINFQLSMLMYLIPGGLLAFLLFTVPLLMLIGLFSTLVIVMNTIRVMNDQSYHYPLTIQFLKPKPASRPQL